MTSRKLISPNIGLTGALLVGLLSQQAMSADELVVRGEATPIAAVVAEQHRGDVEQYIRSFKEELRQTIQEDLKRQLTHKVELAASLAPTRG